MSQLFLLDTSAFRSLSNETLAQLRLQGFRLYVSPYVFWELLCHLDKNKKFTREKGQITKLRFINILDDPRADIKTHFLASNPQFQKHVTDTDLIEAALAALEESETLDAFYSAYIRDAQNDIHQIADCAINVRNALTTEEERYKDFIQEIIQVFTSNKVSLKTDQEYHQDILDMVNGYATHLEQLGISETGLKTKVTHSTYIYYSYVVHRAWTLFNDKNTVIPGNDYEDGYMCLHLKLDTPYCLVTNDHNFRKAIDKTISLLNKLNEPQFHTTLKICGSDHLKSLLH